MKTTYNYFYGKQSITKKQFESVVPNGWENEVVNGEYSYGYYKAIERN
jgi:hypothetical protein